MQYFFAILILFLSSCASSSPATKSEGEAFVRAITPLGTSLITVRKVFARRGIAFSEIAVADCDPHFLDPRFTCSSGPAIWAILNEHTRPWNPFFRPTLVAFLAFDRTPALEKIVVALEGGD